jgi:hypothetical protein
MGSQTMIEWQQTVEPSATYSMERAVVDEFLLVAFDCRSGRFGPAKFVWGIFGPPDHQVVLERGVAADLEAAKAAAECALATLAAQS